MGNVINALRTKTVRCRVSATAYGMASVEAQHRGRPVDRAISRMFEIHKRIYAIQVDAREALYAVSLPYDGEEGWRVLPHVHLVEFVTAFNAVKLRYQAEINQLITETTPIMGELPTVVQDYVQRLQPARAYSLTYHIHDYPALTFPGMAENRAQTLARRVEVELGRVVAACRVEAIRRLSAPLDHMAVRIAALMERDAVIAAGGNPGRAGSLRESVMEKVHAAVNHLSGFNFMEDPDIVALWQIVQPLVEITSDALRMDTDARETARLIANLSKEKIAAVTLSG